MKRLSLLALLLASSSLVAAPAPFAKPQRKPERPATRQHPTFVVERIEEVLVPNFQLVGLAIGAAQPAPPPPFQAPAQPRNADPPG